MGLGPQRRMVGGATCGKIAAPIAEDEQRFSVTIVHDFLTQRGGAERVVLSMLKAFPTAPLHTSLYRPAGTFPDFRRAQVHTMPLNRIRTFRQNHRLALPVLWPAFSRSHVAGDVVVCSSSGWAHGVRTSGRKVVYCHTPAHWLYEPVRYLGSNRRVAGLVVSRLSPWLRSSDGRAASSAHRYVTNSRSMRRRIQETYGIDAEVLPPPHAIDADGARKEVAGLDAGFYLCVSRLLPYKNVSPLIQAFEGLPRHRLIVVGTGPEESALRANAPRNVSFQGVVSDAELRWLYANARAVVAPSYEDYGLVPVEAASFGTPTLALRYGGFLDTVVEGETGLFFDRPEPVEIRITVRQSEEHAWSTERIVEHANCYSEPRFISRLRDIVDEEASYG